MSDLVLKEPSLFINLIHQFKEKMDLKLTIIEMDDMPDLLFANGLNFHFLYFPATQNDSNYVISTLTEDYDIMSIPEEEFMEEKLMEMVRNGTEQIPREFNY